MGRRRQSLSPSSEWPQGQTRATDGDTTDVRRGGAARVYKRAAGRGEQETSKAKLGSRGVVQFARLVVSPEPESIDRTERFAQAKHLECRSDKGHTRAAG